MKNIILELAEKYKSLILSMFKMAHTQDMRNAHKLPKKILMKRLRKPGRGEDIYGNKRNDLQEFMSNIGSNNPFSLNGSDEEF